MEIYQTAEIPSMDLLEKIVLDDKYFHEFSNNKNDIIYGFNFKEIQKHLKDYIIGYMNNNELSSKFLERAKYYNDKFNLDIPKFRKMNDGLDQEFYNYIMEGINDLNNPLVKARAIYLKLAKSLCYDEHATAYNLNLDNVIVQDMFYKRTSEVTLKNNKVICSLWATIYAEFLNRIGINAKVVGGKNHKSVEFVIEGRTYMADATNSFLDKDNLYLNDFTRVKLNSPTYGFSGEDKSDDQQLGFNPKSLVDQYHEYANNYTPLSNMRLTTGDPKIDMIVSKLDYLSTLVLHLPQTEAVGYLRQMVRMPNSIITQDEVNIIMPRLIRLKDENNLNVTSIVIAIKNGDEYIYKLLNVPEGLITVSKEYFKNLIETNKMLDDGNIPGLNQMNR